MTRLLRIAGLHCRHCIEIVERDLLRLPGVRAVRISTRTGEVAIECDPYRVSSDVVEAAIRDAGFHVAVPNQIRS